MGERVAGKYVLKRLLGTGSMGAVYEGVHADIGKRVAIKLLHPELGGAPDAVARFRREARAASAVESEHIVQIFDIGWDPACGLYMVIEYLEGEDLEARLARERWIGERDAATIGVQLARGLAKAHAAGIVHRDLKPANVFLTQRDDGSTLAKILDFGISKLANRQDASPGNLGEPTLTARGTTLGTPQYMSPEQCEGTTALDGRTDVWSLCAVLYEMLAGEPAVSDEGGFVGTMMRIVKDDVRPLRQRAPWVSEHLARAVDAGLVRERAQRVADAAVLAAQLVDAVPDAGASVPLRDVLTKTDVSELGPHPTRRKRRSRRRKARAPRSMRDAPPSDSPHACLPRATGSASRLGHSPPSNEDAGGGLRPRQGRVDPELARAKQQVRGRWRPPRVYDFAGGGCERRDGTTRHRADAVKRTTRTLMRRAARSAVGQDEAHIVHPPCIRQYSRKRSPS